MKTKTFWLVTLLAAGVLTLAGCGKTETTVEENTEIANPASVYCEENGWTLVLEEWVWLCMFPDGSYCEEWSYQRGECQPGEIMYNTTSNDVVSEVAISEIYSDDDLAAAKEAIMDVVDNEWEVEVEMLDVSYLWDEAAVSQLDYCQSLNPEVTDCAIFISSFYIPEQDVQMAGAFEPNTNIDGWSWTLGKNAAGEWEVLSNWFG